MSTRRNFIFGSFFSAVAGMAQPKEQPSKVSMEAELEKVYGKPRSSKVEIINVVDPVMIDEHLAKNQAILNIITRDKATLRKLLS